MVELAALTTLRRTASVSTFRKRFSLTTSKIQHTYRQRYAQDRVLKQTQKKINCSEANCRNANDSNKRNGSVHKFCACWPTSVMVPHAELVPWARPFNCYSIGRTAGLSPVRELFTWLLMYGACYRFLAPYRECWLYEHRHCCEAYSGIAHFFLQRNHHRVLKHF